MRDTLSVIVPTFNLAHLIELTLRTVLAQTDLPDEVVVVDDGSTDDTLAIVRRMADESGGLIRVVARQHSGPGATRNAAIAAAKGTWIAFLDGDDLWLPEKLARVRAAIAADPAATMVTHPCIEVNRAGDELPVPLPGWYDGNKSLVCQLYLGDFLWTSCVAVKRQSILDVSGFDESLWSAQDYDLWLKLARKARLHVVSEFLAKYIVRSGSVSGNPTLRCRALIVIAHRHVPFVAAIVGQLAARRMRCRAILLAYHFVFANLPSARRGDLVKLVIRMPWEIVRALAGPIR